MARMDTSLGAVDTNIKGAVDFGFSAKNASKLAGMMANFLYSDKEYAVISELSANAYDAHRMVGKHDLPIKINFPTAIDQELVIRDFGPGMAEEDVFKYLTQFGESSKQDDNNQIGFWGIGSKSPAAVTQSWSIVSYHNGKKTHFEVFLNEDGVPCMSKVFEGSTTETGLEVKIPVLNNKSSAWRAAAAKAFKHYPIKPEFNDPILLPEVKYSSVNSDYGIREGGSQGIHIITTCREYPLSFDKLGISDTFISALFRHRFDLFFDIGEVDLSISREAIQYNPKTIKAIIAKLEIVKKDIFDVISEKLEGITNSVMYRSALVELWNVLPQAYIQHAIAGNKFGVVNLPNDIKFFTVPWDQEKVSAVVVYNGQAKRIGATSYFRCFGTQNITWGQTYDYQNRIYNHTLSIMVTANKVIKIVTRDGVHDLAARIRYHGDRNTFYLILDKNIFGDEFDVVKGSTFAKVPRTKRENRVVGFDDCYKMNNNSFEKVGEDFFKGLTNCVSIKIKNARSRSAAGNEEANTDMVAFLTRLGYYIIGHKNDKKFDDPKTAIEKFITKMSADAGVIADFKRAKYSALRNDIGSYESLKTLLRLGNIPPKLRETMNKDLKDDLDHLIANPGKYSYGGNGLGREAKFLKDALKLTNRTMDDLGQYDLSAAETFAKNRYPMLQYVCDDWREMNKEMKVVLNDYIAMIDKGV